MSKRTEKVNVKDNRGFHYEVLLEHFPHHGFSNAVYEGRIIGQVELGRITEPLGDDDLEWERYEETFAEWTDEIKYSLIPQCEQHFNTLTTPSRVNY
jgi:hypothetical protein